MKADNEQRVKVSNTERPASYGGSESCGVFRKEGREALTGERTGSVTSHEMPENLEADPVPVWGRQQGGARYASTPLLQRGQRPGARTEVCYTETERSSCRLEVSQPRARSGKAKNRSQTCTIRGSRTDAQYQRWRRTKSVKRPRSLWRESR